MIKQEFYLFAVVCVITAQLGVVYLFWNYQPYFKWKSYNQAMNVPSTTNHQNKRADAVIVLGQMRSGSSIIGEIFNQRSDVFYLYEPLFPFDEEPCESLLQERLQVLRHISKCELSELPSLYSKGFNVTKRNDVHARCKIHNICFTSKTAKVSHFLERDVGICYKKRGGVQICPEPINATVLSQHCRQSLIRAMKVIYLCKLEWLLPLLQDPEVNVKVVHLVRDPRATVNSRVPGGDMGRVTHSATLVCNRLIPNVQYADEVLSPSMGEKYLRIRHEDFSLDPVGMTEKIYSFVGINVNTSIKKWLLNALSSENDKGLSKTAVQGTKRNPEAVLSAWRKSFTLKHVQEIQRICGEVMPILGYRLFHSERELKDLKNSYF